MAWFNRKENGDDSEETPESTLETQPQKARAWFKQAQTAADTRNYQYAIDCYLSGFKFDPTDLENHKKLFEIASLYRSAGGKPASGREVRKMLGDKKPFDRLAAAELAWVTDAFNVNNNLKFLSEAAALGLTDIVHWAGEIGVNVLARSKKPTKNQFVQFVDAFEQAHAYDLAVKVGDAALSMDRADAQLSARIRNLSAQATMNRGKYDENVGESGSFRGSIRDADAQKQLVEDDAMAGGSLTVGRKIERARKELAESPNDPSAFQKLGDLLASTDDHAFETEAVEIFRQAYKQTSEYRFRMKAGDIRLRQERRKLRAMRDRAAESGSPEDQQKFEQGRKALLQAEIREYAERCERYPTDLSLRFELGRRRYEAGDFEDAIAALQEAQGDSRLRSKSQHLIGLCFVNQEWFDEAVDSLRSAVESYEIKDDETHLGMRYDLMTTLESMARENRDIDAANEAAEHAKHIALRQLSFREVRTHRESIRDLIKELRTA